MGHTTYSALSRSYRTMEYETKTAGNIFTQKVTPREFDPAGVTMRESRDSEEHPETVAIALFLDVTGSMREVPHMLIKNGLPRLMEKIINSGVQHPQIMISAIGDHECDDAPLQVGQFESGDQEIDVGLTRIFIEGGGGGNDGESYLLAWFLCSRFTSIDCFEKRGTKGCLFTIGDEPTLKSVPGRILDRIMGKHQNVDCTAVNLIAAASEKYNVYHIHVKEGTNHGASESVMGGWRQLLGDNFLVAESINAIPEIIAAKVVELYKANQSVSATADLGEEML